jgi:hypothetical protein
LCLQFRYMIRWYRLYSSKIFLYIPITFKQLLCDHLLVCFLVINQLMWSRLCSDFLFLQYFIQILKKEAAEMLASWEISSHVCLLPKAAHNNHKCLSSLFIVSHFLNYLLCLHSWHENMMPNRILCCDPLYHFHKLLAICSDSQVGTFILHFGT